MADSSSKTEVRTIEVDKKDAISHLSILSLNKNSKSLTIELELRFKESDSYLNFINQASEIFKQAMIMDIGKKPFEFAITKQYEKTHTITVKGGKEMIALLFGKKLNCIGQDTYLTLIQFIETEMKTATETETKSSSPCCCTM